jgi:signal transduction histidine kinase
MKPDLRVLLIEDSEIDAQLIIRQLKSTKYSLESQRVDTEGAFREALSRHTWDLIICDYQMPCFNAPSALSIVHELNLDLPFIVVSGSISAELAVEMMRQGAHDYLLKGDMTRFVPVIERELLEAEHRQALRESEQARLKGEEELRRAHAELERRVQERTAELSSANTRLRELDRLKSEFLATMSHELRTPLNSIIGFTSLVKEGITGPLNDEQRKQLTMVYSASKHLLGLIDDLLDVSRIEAGKIRLDSGAFDFAGVVAETIAQIKPLAQAKRLALRPQLPPGALPMLGDRRRCVQVMLNLCHNAVKFTEKGSIDIVVKIDATRLRVDVLDTGIGIKTEQLDLLFEAFRQLDGSAKRSYEGTGLGLYLCRKLLTLMNGDISAHSVYGQGTRFTFTLPRSLAPDTPPAAQATHPRHESTHLARRG